METKIIQILNQEDFQLMLSEEKVSFLIFSAEWCHSGSKLINQLKKELDSQMKKIAQQNQHINIFVIDHDREQCINIVKQFAPTILPYTYLFERGKYIAQFGGLDVFALNKIVKKALESCRAL